MEIKKDLLYTKEHEWLRIEENKGTVGITEYAVHTLGDITFVEFKPQGTEVSQFEPLGTVESVKAASDIFSPISGKLSSVNEKVIESPEIMNSSPYDEGWLVTIDIEKPEEKDNLMTPEQYEEYIKGL